MLGRKIAPTSNPCVQRAGARQKVEGDVIERVRRACNSPVHVQVCRDERHLAACEVFLSEDFILRALAWSSARISRCISSPSMFVVPAEPPRPPTILYLASVACACRYLQPQSLHCRVEISQPLRRRRWVRKYETQTVSFFLLLKVQRRLLVEP